MQLITQMAYIIPRSILSNPIDNNNKDINLGQILPCNMAIVNSSQMAPLPEKRCKMRYKLQLF